MEQVLASANEYKDNLRILCEADRLLGKLPDNPRTEDYRAALFADRGPRMEAGLRSTRDRRLMQLYSIQKGSPKYVEMEADFKKSVVLEVWQSIDSDVRMIVQSKEAGIDPVNELHRWRER